MNFSKYRKDFPVLDKVVYLDNAATSLKPRQVIEAMDYYYKECPVNIHRGVYRLSQEASAVYEECHERLARFFNCSPREVILTGNSTDALNMLMYMLYNSNYFKKGDEILTTVYEHHSNLVPWQFLCQKLGLKLKFVEITRDYNFDLDDFKKKVTPRTKLVTFAHISNTIATIAPVKEIVDFLKGRGILVCVDGSQSAPHKKIDFKKLRVDFFVCTAHKMLGPTGVGVLVARGKLLENLSPVRFGGDMIAHVSLEKATWNDLPSKFEAGTPNISGAFGTIAAIDYLERLGMDSIAYNDKKLLEYALDKLNLEGVTIYNPKNPKMQGSIVLFDMEGINSRELSTLLGDYSNIATRAGMHCAEPIISRFNKEGLVRASFYFYNTKHDIDLLAKALKEIHKKF